MAEIQSTRHRKAIKTAEEASRKPKKRRNKQKEKKKAVLFIDLVKLKKHTYTTSYELRCTCKRRSIVHLISSSRPGAALYFFFFFFLSMAVLIADSSSACIPKATQWIRWRKIHW